MYELALSQSEQASQLPILNLFEFCLDIGRALYRTACVVG